MVAERGGPITGIGDSVAVAVGDEGLRFDVELGDAGGPCVDVAGAGARVADVSGGVPIGVGLICVRRERAVVVVVADAVAVAIRIARVPIAVVVDIGLVGVGVEGTVIVRIEQAVVVEVLILV